MMQITRPKLEHECNTCKHLELPGYKEPCRGCEGYNRWEKIPETEHRCGNCLYRRINCFDPPCCNCHAGEKWEYWEAKT